MTLDDVTARILSQSSARVRRTMLKVTRQRVGQHHGTKFDVYDCLVVHGKR